jgi:nucleoside phosphorylase
MTETNYRAGDITGEIVTLGPSPRINYVRSEATPPVPAIRPTVGIVTALPEEFDAMSALTNDKQPFDVADDRADYVLGRLPSRHESEPHQVVLTVLSEAGNNVAATACTGLIRSFRTVNVVLMVGIAAGVPCPPEPRKHVRLGDIVVATWGIVDYDNVEVTPDGVRLRGGFPQPSPLLKNATTMLRSEERRGRRPWEGWLRTAGRDDLRQFARPADHDDILYAADESDATVRHPDRRLSGHRAGLPKVHYGRIGSADRSFRDAGVRDGLAREHELRALEMEGSGIGRSAFLNGLEWFVVRGVSDYADSRRTDAWRSYAAFAAAAYTRALLGCAAAMEPRGGHAKGHRMG